MITLVSRIHRCARPWTFTFLLLALSSAPLAAQDSGRGYFQAGLHWLDLGELNARLRVFGIPAFNDHFATLGGGGYVEIDRVLIGGEGHGLIGQSETSESFRQKLSGGYGFFDVGGLIVRDSDYRIYGLVGVGGGRFELEINERSLASFDEVLADPGRGAELTVAEIMFQTALGADYIVRFDETFGFRGLSLGLRTGFTYGPDTDDWELDGSDTPGGPDVSLTGFYARLSLGGVAGR